MRRVHVRVRGIVQGVGFRPFVHGLARRYRLGGFVVNDADGVLIEIEGARVDEFVAAIQRDGRLDAAARRHGLAAIVHKP